MAAAPSILETPSSFVAPPRGQDAETRRWMDAWNKKGWLAVELSTPSLTTSLGEWLLSAVETELLRFGAAERPQYVGPAAGEVLADQTYRAKMLGFQGLALALPSLAAWARDATLSPRDSGVLLTWVEAVRERGMPLRVHPADARLKVYPAPVTLEEAGLLGTEARVSLSTEMAAAVEAVSSAPSLDGTPRPHELASAGATTEITGASSPAIAPATEEAAAEEITREEIPVEATALEEMAAEETAQPTTLASPPSTPEVTRDSPPRPSEIRTWASAVSSPASTVSRRAAMRSLLAPDDDEDEDEGLLGLDATGLDLRAAPALVGAGTLSLSEGTGEPATEATTNAECSAALDCPAPDAVEEADEAPSCDERDHRVAERDVGDDPTSGAACAEQEAVPVPAAPAEADDEGQPWAWSDGADEADKPSTAARVPHIEVPSPRLSMDEDIFSEHVEQLQTAGGSHGWEDIERLYENHYLPLQLAVRDGAAPALAASVLAEWAKDFAESYEQAFDAIRNHRGKRPRLVLDVPSYAFQLSRKHNAEHLKMVMIDALRADVGALVREKLRVQMGGTAQTVASGLLWAALPTNTPAQMELIARGTDGLRHFSGELTEAQLMSRGNDLRRLRPVRVGSHRMYKLDIVQYLARDSERHSREDLEQYAAEVATSVGRFLRQQEPGTLVYLFGDHGFGGASAAAPEQVLTPYQGWLIGG